MHVAFLYNGSADDPAHATEDEDPARSPVVAALRRLGHVVTPIVCTLDLAAVQRQLAQSQPDVVFNRVESLGGSDGMMAVITLLLDTMRLPYTGNSTAALVATASKVSVKERLATAGLPTPRWITSDCRLKENILESQSPLCNQKFVIKSVFEHASFELDDASVVESASEEHVRELVREREEAARRKYFAEEYIDGREFNISVLGEPPQVLPPAELDFSMFPVGKPRIVSHIAKWDESSFEYNATERLFEFPASDRTLLNELTALTIKCWRLLGLTGYARVDFRCDAKGHPWVLDLNTNPCIAPEAGFAAALEQAGIRYEDGLQQILDDALARGGSTHSVTIHA